MADDLGQYVGEFFNLAYGIDKAGKEIFKEDTPDLQIFKALSKRMDQYLRDHPGLIKYVAQRFAQSPLEKVQAGYSYAILMDNMDENRHKA